MKTCWLLTLAFICTACTSTGAVSKTVDTPEVVLTRDYIVHQQLSLVNEGNAEPGKQNLWVALIRDVPPYQKVISRTISPDKYTLSTDEYGNQYAEFDFSNHPPGRTIDLDIEYRVEVNELTYNLGACEGELLDEFTQAELHIESANPQVIALANDLSKGKKTACEQVRAFYDYAGDELIYTYNRKAWGAQATFGLMGADCTEYASLVIALSRAEGIPARYYEGLLYLEDTQKEAEIAQTEHAWLDVYFPGAGWAAMDPTLGRLPIGRETHFAHYTPNHIIVTTGRNPSTLRGSSYWSHLYWPGEATTIRIKDAKWTIAPLTQ
ncbi:MAG: transglutaminase family protein [Anaerolineales bacterium]|nr:transglutaminase family protein [Anaerolineales bacterium]